MKNLVSKNPLYFAFVFPALIDGIVTLLGQSPEYWSGRVVNEASPTYYFLLTSPWLFLFGSVIWFLFWYWLFGRLKEPLNLFFMFLFIAGHSWGSSSWIWKIMKDNRIYVRANQISVIIVWCVSVLYFALIALFATYCLRVYMRSKK